MATDHVGYGRAASFVVDEFEYPSIRMGLGYRDPWVTLRCRRWNRSSA